MAEKLGRRWITGDLGRFAIHTMRKRLLAIPDVRPFVVQNLGKYERQLWAGAEFGDDTGKQAAARQQAYVEFILKLYQAKPIHGFTGMDGIVHEPARAPARQMGLKPAPPHFGHGAAERAV